MSTPLGRNAMPRSETSVTPSPAATMAIAVACSSTTCTTRGSKPLSRQAARIARPKWLSGPAMIQSTSAKSVSSTFASPCEVPAGNTRCRCSVATGTTSRFVSETILAAG